MSDEELSQRMRDLSERHKEPTTPKPRYKNQVDYSPGDWARHIGGERRIPTDAYQAALDARDEPEGFESETDEDAIEAHLRHIQGRDNA